MKIIKASITFLVVLVGTLTSAQVAASTEPVITAAEAKALTKIRTVKFLLAATQRCEALRRGAALSSKPEVRHDARGRVMTLRTPQGSDVVYEYASDNEKVPSAMIVAGQRIETTQNAGEAADAMARCART